MDVHDVRVMVDAHDPFAAPAADTAALGPLANRQSTVVLMVRGVPRSVSRSAVAALVVPHAARLYRESVRHDHPRSADPWVVHYEEVKS